MNKDKIIKDLKENNRKLKNQYELQEVRLYNIQLNYQNKIDELEEELKTTQEKWKKDKQFYKHRFKDYIEYKNRIDKALDKITNLKEPLQLIEVQLPSWLDELEDVLRGEDNEID